MQWIQNQLGALLDQSESLKNLLNWTQPSKTALVFLAALLLWAATALVKGRYLLLALGLYEFCFVFLPQPKRSPFTTRMNNLLESIPNDVIPPSRCLA